MTDKITLANVVSFQNDSSAVAAISSNNAIIISAFDNTLSRDGTSPNQMGAELDMNSNRIINLPAPISGTEPVRLQDITNSSFTFNTLTVLNSFTATGLVTSADLTPTGVSSNTYGDSTHIPQFSVNVGGQITSASNIPLLVGIAQGGTGATTAAGAQTNLGLGTLALQNANNVNITGGIIYTTAVTGLSTPLSAGDAATKQYVDTNGSGFHLHKAVNLATAGSALATNTYSNGTLGVGATLTATSNGALTVDGSVVTSAQRILVKDEVTQSHNGVYDVTQVGDGSHPYILTRSSAENVVSDLTGGDVWLVQSGTLNASTTWANTTPVVIMGTTNILIYELAAASNNPWQISSANIYFETGTVSIGTASSRQELSVNGTIESMTGGFKFPDATTQTTAALVSGSSGYLQFNNSGVFGSDSNIFWDNTNKRLGIGTTSPVEPLHVHLGSGLNIGFASGTYPTIASFNDTFSSYGNLQINNSIFILGSSQNVGVGTSTPNANTKLDVSGNARATNLYANVLTYGADSTGSADCKAAFALAYAAAKTVKVPAGTYRFSTSDTWPSGITWIIDNGASIHIDSGITITINGNIQTGPNSKVFFATGLNSGQGSGIVQGLRYNRPEWWGAVRNGSTDDSQAIKQAINSLQNSQSSDGAESLLELSPGIYAIAKTITFTLSSLALRVKGCGASGYTAYTTTLLALSSFTGTAAVAVTGSGTVFADWLMGGFSIQNQTAGSGASIGLSIGSTGNWITGLQHSEVNDIYVSGFANDIKVMNTRLLSFHRCSTWSGDSGVGETSNSTGLLLTSDSSSFTCEGIDFVECQFVAPVGSSSPSGTCAELTTATGGKTTAIKFSSCTFYGGSTQLLMSTSSGTIVDIWVTNGSQFEGPAPGQSSSGSTAIVMTATGAQVSDIHIDHAYLSGGGFLRHIVGTTPSGGTMNNIWVTNCILGNPYAESISISGVSGACRGVTISGNQVHDPFSAAYDVFALTTVTQSVVNDNLIHGTNGGRTNFISFNTGGDYYVATGNTASGLATNVVTNGSTATHTLFTSLNL